MGITDVQDDVSVFFEPQFLQSVPQSVDHHLIHATLVNNADAVDVRRCVATACSTSRRNTEHQDDHECDEP